MLLDWYASTYTGTQYPSEIKMLVNSFLPFSLIYIYVSYKKGNELFYPYTMISVLYFLLYILSPITFILINDTDCHGDTVMGGCSYGTFLAILSYFALSIGYVKIKNVPLESVIFDTFCLKWQTYLFMLFFWFIGAFSCIYYINHTGASIMQILFTQSSETLVLENGGDANIKFLASFAYFMIFPVAFLFAFSQKKWLIYPLILATFILFYARGTRIFIVILVLSLLILHVRLTNKKVNKTYVVLGIVGMLCLFSFMGSNRKSVKSGDSVEYKIDITDFIGMLSTNFDIYKPYYGLVNNCPEKFSYTLGHGLFVESIASLIPRALWKDKYTGASMTEALEKTTGSGPISAAMSWPNIAEYYMDFGIIGICVLSYIFGMLLSKSINLLNCGIKHKIILYSLLFPTFFQLIIRGYTPINFTMYICLLFPYYVAKKMNLLNLK